MNQPKLKPSLCKSCLGRMYGKLSTRLTNYKRGDLLAEIISSSSQMNTDDLNEDEQLFVELVLKNLGNDIPFRTTQDENYCELCQGAFTKINGFITSIMEKIQIYEFSNFRCGCKLPKEWLEKEEKLISENNLENNERPQKHFNRSLGRELQPMIEKNADFNLPDLEILIDIIKNRITITPRSIFIAGRYRKLIRTIPQTRWPCRICRGKGCENCEFTGQQYLTSIEEKITSAPLKTLKGKNAKLHGAGREDIDALMLGSGRPFVIEIQNPLIRTINLEKTREQINSENKGEVEVSNLFTTKRDLISEIKTSSPDSTKRYRALIETEQKITKSKLDQLDRFFGSTIIIDQKTPQRVKHRRADLLRKKDVYAVSSSIITETSFESVIFAAGGTYIKELISGDDGRTSPSFTKLMETECTCIELDVLEVNSSTFDKASKNSLN